VGQRALIVAYALAIGWAVLMWFFVGGISYLPSAMILGLPPLVLLLLIRFVIAGRP
jgi:uncharacterized membrane-anchored protein